MSNDKNFGGVEGEGGGSQKIYEKYICG